MPNALTPATCGAACTKHAEFLDEKAKLFRWTTRAHREFTADAVQLREAARLLTTHADVIDSAETMEAEYASALTSLTANREALTHGA